VACYRICTFCLDVFVVVAISFGLLGDRNCVAVARNLRRELVLTKDSVAVAAVVVGELVVDQVNLLISDLAPVLVAGSRNTVAVAVGDFRNSVVDGVDFRNSVSASLHHCIAQVLVLHDNRLDNSLAGSSGSEAAADLLVYEVLLVVEVV